jgi:hypothetical protein
MEQVTGTFLFYARTVDTIMVVALSAIASEQVRPTEETMIKALQALSYVAS